MLTTSRLGRSCLVTIDRPDTGNALSSAVIRALREAIRSVATDDTVRAVIVTGAGNRFFCAGGDLKEYRTLATPDALREVFGQARELLDAIENLPVPVVAAVNGYAVGGGAELLLACDVRLAAPHARIGFSQVELGLIPAWGGTERLVEICGLATAMRLILSGEKLRAKEAVELGLIQAVTAPDVLKAATAFADRVATLPRQAVTASKRVTRNAARLPRAESRRRSEAIFEQLWFTPDHREAEAAFLEKRPPCFRDR